MSSEKGRFPSDNIMGEETRLRIVTYLASNRQNRVSFSELKEELELTSGNLSVQLRRLEEAGYLAIKKKFKGRKPLTQVSLTPSGMAALNQYIEELEKLLNRVKEAAEPDHRQEDGKGESREP